MLTFNIVDDSDDQYVLILVHNDNKCYVKAIETDIWYQSLHNGAIVDLSPARKQYAPFKNEEERNVVKFLFKAMWESENGCTTYITKNYCEQQGVTIEAIEKIVKKHPLFADVVEILYDDGEDVGIMWGFLELFDLNKWDLV